MSKVTARPWRIVGTGRASQHEIAGGVGVPAIVASVTPWPDPEGTANRDFIVYAANNIERVEAALRQIDDIRNSIIGHQNGNWSLHIYPLVAALRAAGIEGLDYDDAKATLAKIDGRIRADEKRNNAILAAPDAATAGGEG